jgi:hypothetical protein
MKASRAILPLETRHPILVIAYGGKGLSGLAMQKLYRLGSIAGPTTKEWAYWIGVFMSGHLNRGPNGPQTSHVTVHNS